MIFFGGGK